MYLPCFILWVVILSLGLGAAERVWAEDNPQQGAKQWLKSMMHAMNTLSYQGTVVYLRDQKVETMRIIHAVQDGVEQDRLLALNDPMREVIRDADKVTCFFPDTRTVVVEYKPSKGSLFVNLPDNLDQHEDYYRFSLWRRERVAERLSQKVSIDPKDDYRYGRRIWIDVKTKLPLKFELLDEQGHILEQMIFTTLSVEKSIPLKDLNATTVQADQFKWHIRSIEILPVAASDAWLLQNLPAGFKQVMHSRRLMPTSNKSVEHILLSDGFSSVSIYIDEIDEKSFNRQFKSFGAINTYSRKIDGFQVTVMGEVPAKTARLIAEGVQYRVQH